MPRLSPRLRRQNETVQHGPVARLALALLLALVAGVRAVAAESVSLEWDPNPEPEVVGYRVFIGNEPGVYGSSVDVGNNTTYSFNAVQPGQRYCFAVAAYFAGPTLGNKSSAACTDANQPPCHRGGTLERVGEDSARDG